MTGGGVCQGKEMLISDPRGKSGIFGGEGAAREGCQVTFFCCLFDSLSSWIMQIRPGAIGYSSSSSDAACLCWMTATCLNGMIGVGGALCTIGPMGTLASGWGLELHFDFLLPRGH